MTDKNLAVPISSEELEGLRRDAARWQWTTEHVDAAIQLLDSWANDGEFSKDELNAGFDAARKETP